MKKLAFFILLSLVTLGVSAQSNLKWNVNAGIGMSNWYGDDTDGTDAKFAYKVGIGLEVPFANTNVWSFQTGLNFISKGVKGNGVTDAWDVVDVTINQLYLELPLMVGARIHTASNFDLLFKGGPYLAYGVGGKTKIDGVSEKADTFGDEGDDPCNGCFGAAENACQKCEKKKVNTNVTGRSADDLRERLNFIKKYI